jgi:catechol 2,3-dioxygenase-like lactoylglutathione lyase family enzyme
VSARLQAISHAGILTDDIERTALLWRRLFGLTRIGRRPTWYAPEEGVLSTFLSVPGGVLEPLQPAIDGIYRDEYLAGRRAYHISAQVENIKGTVAELRAGGLWVQLRPPGEILTPHRGWISKESTGGLPIELIDSAEMGAFVTQEELDAFVGGGAAGADAEPPPIRQWNAVGHVVRDIEPVCRVFADVLGFTPEWDEPREVGEEGVLMQRFRLAGGPGVEVVEPVREHSVLAARLDAAGPGIAYVSMEAGDLDAVVARVSDQQAWLTTAARGETLPRRAWVHARSTDGMPVLLTEGG